MFCQIREVVLLHGTLFFFRALGFFSLLSNRSQPPLLDHTVAMEMAQSAHFRFASWMACCFGNPVTAHDSILSEPSQRHSVKSHCTNE